MRKMVCVCVCLCASAYCKLNVALFELDVTITTIYLDRAPSFPEPILGSLK